jgi:hypothetical protein
MSRWLSQNNENAGGAGFPPAISVGRAHPTFLENIEQTLRLRLARTAGGGCSTFFFRVGESFLVHGRLA